MLYLSLKWIHILSAIVLFGMGLGSAFYKWMSDRRGNLIVIAEVNRQVVLADWLFTTPTVIIQPLTGLWLLSLSQMPWTTTWVFWSLWLYLLAGLCWLPVVWLQIQMRDMAILAVKTNTALPACYQRYARLWFWLGVPAFIAMILVVALMVFKPS